MIAPVAQALAAPQSAGAAGSSGAAGSTGDEAKILQAARQFEALLLKRMLASLERTTKVDGGAGPAGASAYGSMVVEALADAVAQAGGLGLATQMTEELRPRLKE